MVPKVLLLISVHILRDEIILLQYFNLKNMKDLEISIYIKRNLKKGSYIFILHIY